jgi:D-arabinose 1-dehydrogenase-like Zn-dependent alcohol dehydrogenase
MKAVVMPNMGEPMVLRTVPTPTAVAGSVVVKVLAASVQARLKEHLSGKTFASVPKDMTPGSRAIGRVAVAGPDATALQPGKLVLIEPFIRARDDPRNLQILWGIFDGATPVSKKFTADNWAGGTFAEYVKVPLENCHILDEARLLGSPADGGLGYEAEDLLQLTAQVVAYGGMKSIGLRAGETIIVSPATGRFSGSAVQVAAAMGATVIMMSRNVELMKRQMESLPAGRIKMVPNTGDVQADTAALKAAAGPGGEIDAYMDISPLTAQSSTHVRSCFMALKSYGRACLMGILRDDLAMPYQLAVWKNLTIRGQYMYEQQDVRELIKMVENGVLKVGKPGGFEPATKFSLDDFDASIDHAGANDFFYESTVLIP